MVTYHLFVAATRTSPGAFLIQFSRTLSPLSIIMGGTTLPSPLTNVNTVDVLVDQAICFSEMEARKTQTILTGERDAGENC